MIMWQNLQQICCLQVSSLKHLPDKNDFIPCDFSIKSLSDINIHGTMEIPICIADDPLIKIWYKLDRTFNVPRANTYFLITLKEAYISVRTCVLTELYVNLLCDTLNKTLYQATVARLDTTVSVLGDKLELKISGFNEKLPALASKILEFLTTFTPAADRVEMIGYVNTNMKPLKHSAYLRLQILRKDFWHVDDKLSCFLSLTLADFITFIPERFSQIYIEGLCHGNLLKDEAIFLANMLEDLFSATVFPSELRHAEQILRLPSGIGLLQNANVKNK